MVDITGFVEEEIVSHKVNGLNDALVVKCHDLPGPGNACHKYSVRLKDNDEFSCDVKFQEGPIQEAGFNGLSNEALLAIVEHRLQGFQSGQYACRENAVALTKLQECMMWLQKRTMDRVRRGVEGTNQK